MSETDSEREERERVETRIREAEQRAQAEREERYCVEDRSREAGGEITDGIRQGSRAMRFRSDRHYLRPSGCCSLALSTIDAESPLARGRRRPTVYALANSTRWARA